MARGLPTGNTSTAASFICRRLRIPDDVDLIAAVNGALYALTLPETWEQIGTATPEEVAAMMTAMFEEYFTSTETCP